MNDRLALVHNLNQPGLAVDDVAVGNGGFGDLVPAGLAVRQVNEAVCVGDVGTGVICGAIGAVGGAKEADLKGNSLQVLAGCRVQLPNQEALLGSVEELDVDNPVTVRCDGYILPVGVREAVSGRGNGLCDVVGAVGQVLERQLAVAIRLAFPVNGAALGILQVNGVQREGGVRQGPGVGTVSLGDAQVAEVGVFEQELRVGLAPFQGLRQGVIAGGVLLIHTGSVANMICEPGGNDFQSQGCVQPSGALVHRWFLASWSDYGFVTEVGWEDYI